MIGLLRRETSSGPSIAVRRGSDYREGIFFWLLIACAVLNIDGPQVLAAEPRNQAWLTVCDPMQIPLKGEKTWAAMERVFYNP
jgi:L-rhamnose mutarotase